MSNRDRAIELVEEGYVSADNMVLMALKWMSEDEVAEMLDANELSDRFIKEEDDSSPCCGATIIRGDLCSECKEHCV